MVKTFWNNEGLRGSLFGVTDLEPTLDQRLQAKNNFILWVDGLDSRVFNFIDRK
ncbi:hypothetical protein [uncultured Arcticibacterium sp.]|uniref:hypothetical protein n=1 Tax=uncultured Arcticibacterium sp. TaxID=2173042 RepID=UPI0030F7D87B